MTKLKCISPIDGSIYAERELDTRAEIDTRLAAALTAQKQWAKRPVGERVAIVDKAINALEVMNDEIVIELAHMMGRPVRYGGEIGCVKERAVH
ncbi:MAG: aldehyde dehydrogenase family protein, partial [Rhizobiaceae bacterium]|nr:aldehyde dehydrogenase family protein [Rhizobiaceae bacterium]